MLKGEKNYSFVKYEKELESDYRRALEDVKRPEEVGKVFKEYAFRFLKLVNPEIPEGMREGITFYNEDERVFKLNEDLLKYFGEYVEKSDLLSILKRMGLSAQHRYKKLKKDDERTDLFRLGENAKIH